MFPFNLVSELLNGVAFGVGASIGFVVLAPIIRKALKLPTGDA